MLVYLCLISMILYILMRVQICIFLQIIYLEFLIAHIRWISLIIFLLLNLLLLREYWTILIAKICLDWLIVLNAYLYYWLKIGKLLKMWLIIYLILIIINKLMRIALLKLVWHIIIKIVLAHKVLRRKKLWLIVKVLKNRNVRWYHIIEGTGWLINLLILIVVDPVGVLLWVIIVMIHLL
jgi:hypothetical protein